MTALFPIFLPYDEFILIFQFLKQSLKHFCRYKNGNIVFHDTPKERRAGNVLMHPHPYVTGAMQFLKNWTKHEKDNADLDFKATPKRTVPPHRRLSAP
jgi:hypothetical protein